MKRTGFVAVLLALLVWGLLVLFQRNEGEPTLVEETEMLRIEDSTSASTEIRPKQGLTEERDAALDLKRTAATEPGRSRLDVGLEGEIQGWVSRLPIGGKLIFENGMPAPDIPIRAVSQGRIPILSTRSDAEGSFLFPARFPPEQKVWISTEDPRYYLKGTDSEAKLPRLQTGDLHGVLTVFPSPSFSGRVVDQNGQPVAEARVALRSAGRVDHVLFQTTADARGEFRLFYDPGTVLHVVLGANKGSALCTAPVPVQIKDGVSLQNLTIRLVESASIEGVIVDVEGEPIPGANVWTAHEPKLVPEEVMQSERILILRRLGMKRGTSDAEGRFHISGLPPGSYRISVGARGYVGSLQGPLPPLRSGEKRSAIKIVLEPKLEGLSIEGRILTDGGKPLGGAAIRAKFDGKLAPGQQGGNGWATSGLDGSFLIKGLCEGRFTLVCEPPPKLLKELGFAKPGPAGQWPMRRVKPFTTQVAAGSKGYRWEIVVPHHGQIRSQLAHSGEPLQRIRVEFRSGKERWVYRLPVEKGVVFMDGVCVGTYDLLFRSSNFEDLHVQAEVRRGVVADLGVLHLIDAPRVDGTVVDEAGRPIAGAWVGVDPYLDRLWRQYGSESGAKKIAEFVLTQSDSAGRFRIPMKKGCVIYAFKPGHAPAKLIDGATAGKKPQLILPVAGEFIIRAPSVAGGQRVQWRVRLTRWIRSLCVSEKRKAKPGHGRSGSRAASTLSSWESLQASTASMATTASRFATTARTPSQVRVSTGCSWSAPDVTHRSRFSEHHRRPGGCACIELDEKVDVDGEPVRAELRRGVVTAHAR